VLEVGCGNGTYLGTLQARDHRGVVVGGDLSVGMLRAARNTTDGPLLRCDAQAIPFADGAFDVVLAMHMLYHVPDRAAAIAELRRVLRSGGVALVVTNYEAHLSELGDLLVASATAVGIDYLAVRAAVSFGMDSGGGELEAEFDTVDVHQFTSMLLIDDVAPVVAYARSMGAFVTDVDGARDAVLTELARRVDAAIERDGAFRVRTAAGCFVCRS
jgi:SAM-dependent methyltransferase